MIDTGFFEMLLEICRSRYKLKNETKKHIGFFLAAVPEFRTPCATARPRPDTTTGEGDGRCGSRVYRGGGSVWGRV